MLLNEKGEMSRGFEILLSQILKMMKLDPNLIMGQINGIFEMLKAHTAQQNEIIERLKRLEEHKDVE